MYTIGKMSVVIPAHNEQALIAQCLDSVKRAADRIHTPVEIIVCLNACTDNTAAIAAEKGAVLVEESRRNVASVRNTGVAASSGDVIITLDADSRLSVGYLQQVEKAISKGAIGGGSWMFADRITLMTLLFGALLVMPSQAMLRFSGGMFWLRRDVFTAVGGFEEQYLTGEDFALWRKLRRYARSQRQPYGMIWRAYVMTSARKLDELGPWFMLTHPHWYWQAIRGNNKAFANRYLYQTSRSNNNKPEP